MEFITDTFNAWFAEWAIRLPPDAVAARRRGKILHRGWAIWYLFGADERGEYLDCYASHRMTDDSHARLYADGTVESLPAIVGFRVCAEDPAEDARLEAAHLARNQEVARMLEEKGFGLAGDEPVSVQVNRFLRLE
jgi:hypothetical protein